MVNILVPSGLDETEVIVAEPDPTHFALRRRLFPLLKQRRPGVYGRLTEE